MEKNFFGAIKMKKLSVNIEEKSFRDFPRTIALNKVNFGMRDGEFVCILGPSGCGKTTLLRLIAGLDRDYTGEIAVNNNNGRLEKECAIVFQEPRLLPWLTIEENLRFGLAEDNAENGERLLQESLGMLELQNFAESYPSQLSGGMEQKVALSRAIIRKPGLLLLDEPFASLDQLTKMSLQDELLKIIRKEKITAVMVTHDIEEAVFLADRIIIMSPRPGRIIADFKIHLKDRNRTGNAFRVQYQKILKKMVKKIKTRQPKFIF